MPPLAGCRSNRVRRSAAPSQSGKFSYAPLEICLTCQIIRQPLAFARLGPTRPWRGVVGASGENIHRLVVALLVAFSTAWASLALWYRLPAPESIRLAAAAFGLLVS